MTVTTSMSLILASISAVLIFSGMQMYKPWLTSSQIHTLLGGYFGSLIFLLSLTAIGNLEACIFGRTFQIKIFPEVIFCMLVAIFASATIHRVCATSCLLISLCSLYYMNKYSQKVHTMQQTPVATHHSGKKKKNIS